MTNQLEDGLINVLCLCSADSLRVTKFTAARWLLENKTVVKSGTVRYLQIKDLGLGVCEVKLRPTGKINTFVVSTFED